MRSSPTWTSLASPRRGRSIPSQLCWVEDSFQLHRAPAEQRSEQFREEAAGALTGTLPHLQVSSGGNLREKLAMGYWGILWHLTQMTQGWRHIDHLHPRAMSSGTKTSKSITTLRGNPCFNCSSHQGCSCQAQHNQPKREQLNEFHTASSISVLTYSTCHPVTTSPHMPVYFFFRNTRAISGIVSQPPHRKYPTGERSHNKAVSPPITIFHGWEGRKGMDNMHFLLLKTEESLCLLTKGPNIRISCANNKLCYYLCCTKQFGFYWPLTIQGTTTLSPH